MFAKPTRRDLVLVGLTVLGSWVAFSPTITSRISGVTFGSVSSYGSSGGGEFDPSTEFDAGSDNSYINKLGTSLGNMNLGGWFGATKGMGLASQGHSQGNIGMEMVCEVGAGGEVRVHGYSDSVAKVSSSLSLSLSFGSNSKR